MMGSEPRHDKLKVPIGPGFYDSDLSIPQFENQMQDIESHAGEVFHPPAGMEVLSSPWKNNPHRDRNSIPWKGFLDKSSPSSSKTMAESSIDLYRTEFQSPGFSVTNQNESLVIAPESAWLENRMLMDDSSLRFMIPCESKERPCQGLSLSLCPDKPSHIGIQSFELRESSHPQISSSFQDGFAGKAWDFHPRQVLLQEDRSVTTASGPYEQLRSSKFLTPAQQLLTEFCSLGAVQNENKKPQKSNQWEEGVSSRSQNLSSSDLLELQKRKAKLLAMLDEVHRRYRQYCDQMRAVVSSFEAVAGPGSATVYSRLAFKAMSRHFRCLKDGIVGQIKATKKAMGEKDVVAPGTTRGETPRLKLLDQSLRQQRAFQQMGVESHPWRPQRGLPERSVSILRAWLFEHFLHPYPSDVDKHILARQTSLSRSQVSNWFINARVRLWKPMVEEMYMEETKEQETKDLCCISGVQENGRPNSTENPNASLHSQNHLEDQKPSSDQLVPHHDSDSLSSIINNSDKRNSIINRKDQQKQHEQDFPRSDAFGVVDLDFSYSHTNSGVTYANSDGGGHHNFAGSNGVSLTLGLQQHGAGGMGGLSFSPAGSQHSLFFSRQHMDDGQPIQYSILEGESQNLPYRSLMGAQLLHDLAG